MRLGVIGIGQAGGRIADLLTYHHSCGSHGNIVPFSLAINTAVTDLAGISTIPKRDRILIGHTEVKGHGVGLVRRKGAELMESALPTIVRTITEKCGDNSSNGSDAYMVIAGLGGGTGSGGVPVLGKKLKELYPDPVYALGILPDKDEGSLAGANAAEAVQELYNTVDAVILFDNNLWKKEGLALRESYSLMNELLIKPFIILLGIGEAKRKHVGIKIIDASDIINTFSGLSVIGYAGERVNTFKERLLFFKKKTSVDELGPALKSYAAVKNAATTCLSANCELHSASKALMIIAGSPQQIDVEGFFQAKSWLEKVTGTMQIRAGDYPVSGASELAGVVLLSGINNSPLLNERLGRVISKEKVKIETLV